MSANSAQSTGPCVLLLSLDKMECFNETYKDLLADLRARAYVAEATDLKEATKFLSTTKPSAILVTDPTITGDSYDWVIGRFLTYIHEGGTAVFCCEFSDVEDKYCIDAFFGRKLDLSWRVNVASDCDVEVLLNSTSTRLNDANLPRHYSLDGRNLYDLNSEDTLYLNSSNSSAGSMLVSGSAAFTSVGEGRVGYVGDYYATDEAKQIILAMCGL